MPLRRSALTIALFLSITGLSTLLSAADATTSDKAPKITSIPEIPSGIHDALQNKEYAGAIQLIDAELKKDKVPTADYLLYLKGRSQTELKIYDRARATFEAIETKFPDSPWLARARFGRADVSVRQRDYREAGRIYEAAAKQLLSDGRKDQLSDIYLEFADRYFEGIPSDDPAAEKKPDFQQALTYYQETLKLSTSLKRRQQIELRIARCLQETNKLNRAIAAYQTFIQQYSSENSKPEQRASDKLQVQARFQLGRAQLAAGQAAEARKTWQDFLAADLAKKSGKDLLPQASYGLASTYGIPAPATEGDLELGVAALETFLKTYPEHKLAPKAEYEIAQSYISHGRHDQAILRLKSLIDNKAYQSAQQVAEARYLLGESFLSQKKFTEAIAAFRAFLENHPTNKKWAAVQRRVLDSEFQMAAEQRRNKNYDKARRLWETFLNKYPLDTRAPGILYLFGSMKYSTGMALLKQEADQAFDSGEESFDSRNVSEKGKQLFASAIADWKRLVSKYPNTPESSQAAYMVGVTMEDRLAQLAEALEAYKKVTGPFQSAAQKRIANLTAKQLDILTERKFRSNEKPHIKLRTRNIENLSVKVYRIDMLDYFRKMHLASGVETLDIALIDPDQSWEYSVDGYEKYRQLLNDVNIPVDGPGVTAVTISGEKLEATTMVIVSDLDIIVKSSRNELFAFAQNMLTNKPAEGVSLLLSDGKEVFAEEQTNADGILQKSYDQMKSVSDLRVFAVQEGNAASSVCNLNGLDFAVGLAPKGYLYTDRPAYRAGQLVNLKGIIRWIDKDTYHFKQGEKFKLDVYDARSRLVFSNTVALNKFGTFADNFILPETAPQGNYRVHLHQTGDKQSYETTFQVREYKLEPIQLLVDLPKHVYYRGETIEGKIALKYYYGTPLAGKTIHYRLAGGRQHIATTNDQGEIPIEFETRQFSEAQQLPLFVQFPERSLALQEQIFLATRGFDIEVKTIRKVYITGETFDATVNISDPAGKPVGTDLKLEIFEISGSAGPYAARSGGGFFSVSDSQHAAGKPGERWIKTYNIKSDKETGEARQTIRIDKAGRYILRVTGTDQFKNPVSGSSLLKISGDDDNIRLRILADKHLHQVGDTANVQLHWREKPALALVTYEGATILGYRLVELKTGANPLAIPMESKLAPNFNLSVAVMDKYRFHQTNSEFRVERKLNIQLKPNQTTLKPGDELAVDLRVTDSQGKPVSAELSLALIQKNLLEHFGSSQTDINDFFGGGYRQPQVRAFTSTTFSYLPKTRDINKHLLAEQIREEREYQVRIDKEFAQIVNRYNDLYRQRRYAEAEMLGRQARQLNPTNPVAVTMFHKAQFARRNKSQSELQGRKENALWESLNEVEEAAMGHFGNSLQSPNSWEYPSRRRQDPFSEDLNGNAALEIDFDFDVQDSIAAPGYGGMGDEGGGFGGGGYGATGEKITPSFSRSIGDLKKQSSRNKTNALGYGALQRNVRGAASGIILGDKSEGGGAMADWSELKTLINSPSDSGLPGISDGYVPLTALRIRQSQDLFSNNLQLLGELSKTENTILSLNSNGEFQAINGLSEPQLEELAKQGMKILPGMAASETGYWNPVVVTDKDGKARVTFRLPNRSTAWKLQSAGTDPETLTGQTELEIITKKDLFGEIKTPLAFTEGDKARVLVEVHNAVVKKDEKITVTLKTKIGERTLEQKKTITSKGPGLEEISFPVELTAGDSVAFELSITDGKLTDNNSITVPIRPYGLPVFATKSGSSNQSTTIFVDHNKTLAVQGPELEILIGPSVNRTLLEAVLGGGVTICETPFILPPSGMERSISDALGGVAMLDMIGGTRTSNTPEAQELAARVQSAVSQLVSSQRDDGSWNWSGRPNIASPDRFLTSRAVWALSAARTAGFAVPQQTFNKAVTWLKTAYTSTNQSDREAQAIILHGLTEAGAGDFAFANRLYRERNNLSASGRLHVALVLAKMDRKQMTAELLKLVNLPVTTNQPAPVDQRLLPWMKSEIELRALYLLALEAVEPTNAKAAQLADWLMAHRRGSRWIPEKANGPAIAALASWFGRAEKINEKYTLSIYVNEKELKKLTVDPASDGSRRLTVPAEMLVKGKPQRINFDLAGRGTFSYSVVLGGFVPADKLKSTTNSWKINRTYEQPPRMLDGEEIPSGFSVVAGNVTKFGNDTTQLPLGDRTDARLTFQRYRSRNNPTEHLDYLVITDPIPAGTVVLTESIKGPFQRYEITPGAITFYIGETPYAGTIKYSLVGYLPGDYRAVPAVARSFYQPDRIAIDLAKSKALKVLARGGKSRDEYKITPSGLYHFGKRLMAKRDYYQAYSHLTNLYRTYPLHANYYKEVVQWLFEATLALDKHKEIVEYFEIIKERYPDVEIGFESIMKVANAYRELGEYERSYLVYRATVEASFQRESRIAGFLDAQGEFLRSVEVMEQILKQYPAESYIATATFSLAGEVYGKGLEAAANQKLRAARVNRVDLIAAAIQMMDHFLSIWPRDPAADQAAFSMANAYLDLEQYQASINRCELFAKRYPDSKLLDSFWYVIGYSQFALGHHQEALKMCRQVADSKRKDPNTGIEIASVNKWQAIYIMGQVYHSLGKPAEAITEYGRVKQRFPDASEAINFFTRKTIALPEVTTVKPGDAARIPLKFRNVAGANVKVYRIDLLKFGLMQRNLNRITAINLAGIRPYHELTLQLGDGKDYRNREQALDLPLKEEGAYLVVCRGENLYTSGLILVSPLKLQVQEDAQSGRVRITVKDIVADKYKRDVQVKVIGSSNDKFISGETDLRGILVADDIRGTSTIIAKSDKNRYAFYRGKTILGNIPTPNAPAREAGKAQQKAPSDKPTRFGREILLENMMRGNTIIQGQQRDQYRKLLENKEDGVKAKKAF